MSYRLIALDIDGTIRSEEYPLSDRTLRALDRVTEAGAAVTIATGRSLGSALKATASLGLTSPVVSFQGAHVADPVTGEVLWHMPLEPAMTLLALDELDGWDGLEVLAYHEDKVYVSNLTDWSEGYGRRNSVDIRQVPDLRELADWDLTRLLAVGPEDAIRTLDHHMNARYDGQFYATRSLPNFCEILNPLGGKDMALEWMCGQMGLDSMQAVAFGNGYNDVRMLQWAGLGVAVGGAVPEAIEVADRVAPPIEEDGVAQVLEDLMSEGQIG